MSTRSLRLSFVLFHITLAGVIFIESVRTAISAISSRGQMQPGLHLAILAGAEAVGALLFLLPRTMRAGAAVLLLIFAIAIVTHGIQHELPLLVYASAVLFVTMHGSGFSKELI